MTLAQRMNTYALWLGYADETSSPDPFSGTPLLFIALLVRESHSLR